MRGTQKAGLILGILLAAGSGNAVAETKDAPFRIGVRVYNFAEVSPAALARAQRAAAEVFERMGIVTEWFECPLSPEELLATPACASGAGPANLVMKLVPNHMAEQFYGSRHSLGFALLSDRGKPTSDAWVFAERVVQQAKAGEAFFPAVLGYAMAHEIGHLLLGKGSHASSGIMKGSWGKKDLRKVETGELGFNGKQVSRMLEQVAQRFRTSGPA
ncbi:MAG: hypothetical protein GY953_53360 [bacterium]|nr:hypothetical protein [bacterium]